MFLTSQNRMNAIDVNSITFFVIPPDKSNCGNFMLMAKTPYVNSNFYDYLILFEHENLNVVKHVMSFLTSDTIRIPHDDEDKNSIVVDLPNLYRYGMKKIAPE